MTPLFPHQEWASQWDCNIRRLSINVPSFLAKVWVVTINASLYNSLFTSLTDQTPPSPGLRLLSLIRSLMKLLKRPVNKGLPFGLCFDPSSADFIVEELTLISSLDGDLSVAAK